MRPRRRVSSSNFLNRGSAKRSFTPGAHFSNPLLIALVSPFPPLKGGIARFSSRLQTAFEETGIEVIAVPFRRLYPRWLLSGRTAMESGAGQCPASPFFLDLMNPLTWFRTASLIRQLKPDVIVVAYWTGLLAPLCAVMRRLSGRKTVVLLHNFTSHEKLPGEKLLKRLLVASSDGFITLSESVSRELAAFSAGSSTATLFHPLYEPQGVVPSKQDARRRMGLAQTSKVLLFFGYVREYKGLDTLFEAMAIVLKQDPSVRLVVSGEFILDVARFRELARRLGIAGSVDIQPGYVPAERVSTLFASADAVVLPYRSASQSGIVPLAVGHGVPVIACDAGALGAQIRHGRTGWIVEHQGPSALAEGILEFFNERDMISFQQGFEESRTAMSWKAFTGEAAAFLEICTGGAA